MVVTMPARRGPCGRGPNWNLPPLLTTTPPTTVGVTVGFTVGPVGGVVGAGVAGFGFGFAPAFGPAFGPVGLGPMGFGPALVPVFVVGGGTVGFGLGLGVGVGEVEGGGAGRVRGCWSAVGVTGVGVGAGGGVEGEVGGALVMVPSGVAGLGVSKTPLVGPPVNLLVRSVPGGFAPGWPPAVAPRRG
nr:hypothetical protein GCM10017745_14080 [Saccharothrix mutabilis subsp. capreolus]